MRFFCNFANTKHFGGACETVKTVEGAEIIPTDLMQIMLP